MNAKEKILKRLLERQGEYVSGEELADELDVSRTAVWKAVSALKSDGIPIESSSRKGHKIPDDYNPLSEDGIRRYLHTDGIDFVILPSTDSTNNEAKRLAERGSAEGTVVIAFTQTAGKGRLGRKFYSPSDSGVYMTVTLRPKNREVVPYLTVMAAVAVAEGVENAGGKHTEIKWVNDVFCGGKKCTGILTEASSNMENGELDFAVVGIGINVTTPNGGFPKEIRDIATAVLDGVKDARNKVVASVLNVFFENYRNFDKDNVVKRYRDRSFLLGRDVIVVKTDSERRATVKGIDDECHLIVEYSDGKTDVLSAGEVRLKW